MIIGSHFIVFMPLHPKLDALCFWVVHWSVLQYTPAVVNTIKEILWVDFVHNWPRDAA